MLSFTVFGVAQPKGSHRAFTPRGMKFPIVTDSNRSAKAWAQLVAERASLALENMPAARLEAGAVRVTVAFFLPRPKALRKRLDTPHLKAPDLDKLIRCVLDALTAIAWLDDSQVVEILALKRYASLDTPPHATITVVPTTGIGRIPVPIPAAPTPLFDGA